MKKYFAVAGLVVVTMIWGGGFVASDMALLSLTPFQIMSIRFCLGTVIMGAVCSKELKGITKKEVKAGSLMGLALFVGFSLQIIALQYTTPSKNAFLTATNVVMVPFIAYVLSRKKIGTRGIFGAALAIFGVGLLSLNRDFSLSMGDGLTLVCAAGFAFQIYFTSIFVNKYRVAVLNFIQMAVAFFLSAVFMAASGEIQIEATAKGWMSVLYLGLISTAVCYLLQTTCQKYVDETKAAIILSMESVFGTLFSILILKEQVTAKMIAGCVIILAAVFISNSQTEGGAASTDIESA